MSKRTQPELLESIEGKLEFLKHLGFAVMVQLVGLAVLLTLIAVAVWK